MIIEMDWETRSRCDLRVAGAYVYAADPSTEVISLSYSVDGGSAIGWLPNQPMTYTMDRKFFQADEYWAHNAAFEYLIWKRVARRQFGWICPPPEKFFCSMALCAIAAIPMGLDDAAEALGLGLEKDKEGHRVMMSMTKPRRPTESNPSEWFDDDERTAKMLAYNKQDVVVETAIKNALPPITDSEREVYLLDQRINQRGIPVDVELIEKGIEIERQCLIEGNEKIAELTAGKVLSAKQVAKMLDFLVGENINIDNLKSKTVSDTIENVTGRAREILQLRQQLGRSSTAKLKKMTACLGEDNRIRGAHLYHGATTGRFAGRLIQIQNFPRGFNKDQQETAIPMLLYNRLDELELLEGDTLTVLSKLLRGCIKAPKDKQLIISDFASIEARVLAWIAGEAQLVEAFENGVDVYKDMAAKIHGVAAGQVTVEQRHLGKAVVLGCGYGMGAATFIKTCENWGINIAKSIDADQYLRRLRKAVKVVNNESVACFLYRVNDPKWLTDRQKNIANQMVNNGALTSVGKFLAGDWSLESFYVNDIIRTYRETYPRIVDLWRNINWVAKETVSTGVETTTGTIAFRIEGDWLTMRLASDRKLYYYQPNLQDGQAPWGPVKNVTYMGQDTVTRQWTRQKTYGGKLTENYIQAIARDILVEAMFRLEKAGYSIVAHIHDEVICETNKEKLDSPFNENWREKEVNGIMEQRPDWAKDCPIAAETFTAERYRK